MELHEKKAVALFEEGYNCAQATLCSFAEDIGLPFEMAVKLASSMGGGMGRLREVCGALTGVFLAAGMKYGYTDPSAAEEKAAHYERIQLLARQFKEEAGSILCRELLALPEGPDQPTPEARTEGYYRRRPCGQLVGMAARLMDEMIREEEKKRSQGEAGSCK